MNKLITAAIAILTLSFSAAQAQFTRGTVMLGTSIGSTGYSSANSDYGYDVGTFRTTSTHNFTISGGQQMGIFLSPHLVIGATPSLAYTTSHVKTDIQNTNNTSTGSNATTNTFTISIGPYVRYYFASVPGNNWFYFQGNGSVGTGTGSNSGNSFTATSTSAINGKVSDIFTWNAGGSLGITHLFYKRIGLDLSVGYLHAHTHNYNVNNTSTINKTSGDLSASTNNYTLGTGTNSATLGFGFHWFMEAMRKHHQG
jgi:hypothetical protein